MDIEQFEASLSGEAPPLSPPLLALWHASRDGMGRGPSHRAGRERRGRGLGARLAAPPRSRPRQRALLVPPVGTHGVGADPEQERKTIIADLLAAQK